MKKRYIIILIGIILAIAYLDLIDNCKQINYIKAHTYFRIGK